MKMINTQVQVKKKGVISRNGGILKDYALVSRALSGFRWHSNPDSAIHCKPSLRVTLNDLCVVHVMYDFSIFFTVFFQLMHSIICT